MLTDIDSLRRLDLQLLAMIDDARRRLRGRGIATRSQVLLSGFSAAGMFVNRFSMVHPERVLAVASGSPGGWPLAPAEAVAEQRLPYPVGVADLPRLFGRGFDLQAFRQVRCLCFLGDQDENDAVDFEDGFDPSDKTLVDALFGDTPVGRWPSAQALYEDAGTGCHFRLYEGVGHTITNEMISDLLEFFTSAMDTASER